MENNQVNTQKSKTKKVVLVSLGTLALGTLTFFGIKFFNKSKNKTNDQDIETTANNDSETSVQTSSNPKPRASLPAANVGTSFPLRFGSKGSKVMDLQNALIRTFGTEILPKYGADGWFGTELQSALRSKGYGVPLQESDFQKITQEKKSEAPKALVTYDASAIAKGIYSAIILRDYSSAITLLKTIKDTTTYSLVSERMKDYRINGVRQTLVNAMLSSFTEKSQKESIQIVFKNMGLKYDGTKWSI